MKSRSKAQLHARGGDGGGGLGISRNQYQTLDGAGRNGTLAAGDMATVGSQRSLAGVMDLKNKSSSTSKISSNVETVKQLK